MNQRPKDSRSVPCVRQQIIDKYNLPVYSLLLTILFKERKEGKNQGGRGKQRQEQGSGFGPILLDFDPELLCQHARAMTSKP